MPKKAIRFLLSICLEILSLVRIFSLALIIAWSKSVVDFDLLWNELPRFNKLIALSEEPNWDLFKLSMILLLLSSIIFEIPARDCDAVILISGLFFLSTVLVFLLDLLEFPLSDFSDSSSDELSSDELSSDELYSDELS